MILRIRILLALLSIFRYVEATHFHARLRRPKQHRDGADGLAASNPDLVGEHVEGRSSGQQRGFDAGIRENLEETVVRGIVDVEFPAIAGFRIAAPAPGRSANI